MNRPLGFNPNRSLSFVPNRDLGFGKKGRIFRGYVCSACEAAVSALDTQCTQCGAIFETKAQITAKKEPKTQPQASGKTFCTYCGSQIEAAHSYCGKCGMRLRTFTKKDQKAGGSGPGGAGDTKGYAAIRLPAKKEKKTVMDWSETGKEFKDLIGK